MNNITPIINEGSLNQVPSMYQNLAGSPVADRVNGGYTFNRFFKFIKQITAKIDIRTYDGTAYQGSLVIAHGIVSGVPIVEIYKNDYGISMVSSAIVDNTYVTIKGSSSIPITNTVELFIFEILTK